MGEARNRKLKDKLYGKVRDDQRFRGLVLSSPMQIHGGKISVTGGLHCEELRYGLLFWDKLVFPESNSIYVAGGKDVEYLQGLGVLERPNYTVNGDAAQGMLSTVICAYNDLEYLEPGCWAILEGPNSLSYEREGEADQRGFIADLVRCIPVPAGDVPIPEILEFKERRRDELLLLRAELERVSAKASQANDPADYLEKSSKLIDNACRDVLAVSHEWQFPFILADKRIEFSLDIPKAYDTFVKVQAEWVQRMPATESFLDGVVLSASAAVASQFNISASPKIVGLRRDLGPYAYTYRLHKELGAI